MANFFVTAVLATTTAITGAVAYTAIQSGEEPALTAATNIAKPNSWLVSQLGSSQTCRITGRSLIGAKANIQGEPVVLSAKCNSGFPTLEAVAYLLQDTEGNTHLKNAEGETLVEFASAEQWAQESVYPKSAMMTLELQN